MNELNGWYACETWDKDRRKFGVRSEQKCGVDVFKYGCFFSVNLRILRETKRFLIRRLTTKRVSYYKSQSVLRLLRMEFLRLSQKAATR